LSTLSIEHPRRQLDFRGPAPGFRLMLKRNCSISPSGLLWVFALISLVTLGIGAGFAALGAWLVLPFAGIEVLALAAGFLMSGRHASDYERIDYAPGRLTVEVARAECISQHDFDPRHARVHVQGERVLLQQRARDSVELGRHLDPEARAELAAELAKRLR
jgi:uncharacterized membrane protein